MTKVDKLKKRADMLRELGDDWKKNRAILTEIARGNRTVMEAVKRLCKKNNQGNLAKLGLTLIAFPFPIIIDDMIGYPLLAAGLIQRKIKNSGLYLEDLKETFPRIIKELQELKQDVL